MADTIGLEEMHPWPLPQPAGLVRRVLSGAADLLLLGAAGVILATAQGAALSKAGGASNPFFFALAHPKGFLAISLLWAAAMGLVCGGYYALLWGACGRTCGQAIWGLRVVRADGADVGVVDAFRREAFALLSMLPLGAGYWWSLFNAQRLTWHDRLSRTRVVRSAPPGFCT